MSEEADIFSEYLSRNGMRMTAVRREIVRFIETSAVPFSVADLHEKIRVDGTALDPASIYRNLILLKKAGLVEDFPEKMAGKSLFRLKKVSGRIYELHCPGCHRRRNFDDAALDAAILGLCEKFNLQKDGIRVRIEARHRRHKE